MCYLIESKKLIQQMKSVFQFGFQYFETVQLVVCLGFEFFPKENKQNVRTDHFLFLDSSERSSTRSERKFIAGALVLYLVRFWN